LSATIALCHHVRLRQNRCTIIVISSSSSGGGGIKQLALNGSVGGRRRARDAQWLGVAGMIQLHQQSVSDGARTGQSA